MKEEVKEKKKLPKVAIIVGSILLAIVVAVLVLSLVKVDTVNALDGYSFGIPLQSQFYGQI